jgi:anti-anti-sigma factor
MAISSTIVTPKASGGLVAPTYPIGDTTIIVASGHLDAVAFLALSRRMTDALEEGGRHLVLDLHEVDGIEPDALGFLWATLRGVRRTGATLAVAGAQPSLLPALKTLDLDGLSVIGCRESPVDSEAA